MPVLIRKPVPGVQVAGYGEVSGVPGAFVTQSGLHAWLTSRLHGRPDPDIYRRPESNALLRAAGPVGGMVEAISYRRYDENLWEIQISQLLVAADGDEIPHYLHPLATGTARAHIVLRKPTRRVLAKYMGKVFRYPRFLLMPDTSIEEIIEYLDTRYGRRLVACYGKFRSRTEK